MTINRHILSSVKFCGAFELALHGQDESESSDNPGIFCGLVDFVASLDNALKEHLENATVFKVTSKTVQKELPDCMLSVVREQIIKEAQADEMMDTSTQNQLVLRYINDRNMVQERFFEFIPLQSIATALSERLSGILPDEQKGKLICQADDGVSVMKGATSGVQRRIQRVTLCPLHPLLCTSTKPDNATSYLSHF